MSCPQDPIFRKSFRSSFCTIFIPYCFLNYWITSYGVTGTTATSLLIFDTGLTNFTLILFRASSRYSCSLLFCLILRAFVSIDDNASLKPGSVTMIPYLVRSGRLQRMSRAYLGLAKMYSPLNPSFSWSLSKRTLIFLTVKFLME